MAGGSGTRFWPASRSACPKQLLDLTGGQTMIQETVARLETLVSPDRVLVVTGERLVPAIRQQLPQLPAEAILGEPCRRDTAPCIGLAAHWVLRHDPEAVMVVLPADHVIQPVEAFQQTIRLAATLVRERPERLVTFGIRPTYPAETFGYIERGAAEPARNPSLADIYRVARFREKPRADVARQFLASGQFYWNSGIFVWKAVTILEQLRRHEPAISGALERIARSWDTPHFAATLRHEFEALPGKSIDYAVMERAAEVVVIEAPFAWDDVGSWQAIARLCGEDAAGNTVVGRHLGIDTTGCIVRSAGQHLIVTLGLHDCIVVHTPDATLVANKHDEESIRAVVKLLQERGWQQYL
jgi:mannose-1-phosphate guanylyltransferase